MLEVDDLKKYYGVGGIDRSVPAQARPVKANEELTFEAREAETVAIVGESGCGKSTFAKVLMGLETATDGEVRAQRPGDRPTCRSRSATRRPCRRSR